MIFTAVLWGSVLPAVLVGVTVLICGFLPGLLATPLRRAALPVAFAFGFAHLNSVPSWPPVGSTNGLFFIALFCFVWSYMSNVGGRYSQTLRWIFWALSAFVFLKSLIINGNLRGDIPGLSGQLETLVQMILVMVFGQVIWNLYERSSVQLTPTAICLLPTLIMAGLSALLLFKSSGLLSQLAGTYCAVHTALLVLTLLNPRFFHFQDHQSFTAVMLFAFSILAYFYMDAPLWMMGLILLPLLVSAFWSKIPLAPQTMARQSIALLLISGISIGIALWPYLQNQNPY